MTTARVLNLTFHGIGEPPPQARRERWNWLTPEDFEATLDAVRERPDVRITLDDSYASDLDIAMPALSSRNMTATFLVVAGRLGRPHYLGEGDVAALSSAGMTIGSHGMRHRPWRRLDASESDEEVVRAKARLEELAGARVDEAACPFGAYDRRSLRALRQAGFRRVYTSDGGWARPEAWLQPRNTLAREGAREVRDRLAQGDLPERPSTLQPLKSAIKRWR